MIRTIKVNLFGKQIGVLRLKDSGICDFQYTSEFCASTMQPAPLTMPAIPGEIYSFPFLSRETFNGLPGMIADSLPDRFGRALLAQWLTAHGRNDMDENVLEKLSFQGKRCMGALEYVPSRETYMDESSRIELGDIIETARIALSSKEDFKTCLQNKEKAIMDILKIGTSAGGQRAKAVIAINDTTKEIRSGQIQAPEGFEYWLLKFDGFDSDGKPTSPANFGRREYAFSQCVKDAGIQMTECRLIEENGRAHFMTKRFDRVNGQKLHSQTLCALMHYDFNMPGAYSYEQAFATMRRLGCSYQELEEQFARMVFNVLSLNMDDHTKNITFLMNRSGEWSLSPAYDMGFNYNPNGQWTSSHQMTINSKRVKITSYDIMETANRNDISGATAIIEKVDTAVMNYPEHAKAAGIPDEEIKTIMTYIKEERKLIAPAIYPIPKKPNQKSNEIKH